MDNFNFNLLKYFYYVVLYNGVTNASKNLTVAQPSLSLSIKKLESELGKVLVDRSSYQFQLTEEGEKLYEIIKPAFETIEDNIKFDNNEKKYLEINIGINSSYAKVVLGKFIKYFREEYPKVKINIDMYSKLDIDKVKDGEYDIVIDDTIYFKNIENVTIENLARLKNYFVCGDLLYEEYKDVKSLSECGFIPFISYKPSLKMGKIRELRYKNDYKFLEVVSVNESDLYFELIEEGMGLGFSNELLLKKYINNNTLHIISVDEVIFDDVLGVLYINENDIINKFVSMLKKYIEEEIK